MSIRFKFHQGIISAEAMEAERLRVAAITPFLAAQAEAINVVRAWTRGYIAAEASAAGIIDLQDAVLNSPEEQDVIDDIRAAFAQFLTDAGAATTLPQLGLAWGTYRVAIAAV